ncbi:MAG TPA: L-lactate dehydrogenase [Syntrophorhabdaceae bacterium]|nr:L-lactate dehydrogenase [Syntrophorhabdaceae bacterium]
MPKVVIVGAGSVGTTIAYTLQISGVATEIVLIDSNPELAEGQSMDMNHGLPFVPPVSISAGNYPDCSDSDVIIITAGARQKQGETRLDLVDRNAKICREIVDNIRPYTTGALLLVVTNPVDLMTYVILQYSGLSPGQVIGSGTVLDSARFRYFLSQHCAIDTRNVHAYVIGEHGDSEVLLWSQVRMAGSTLESFCTHCRKGCGPVDKTQIMGAVKNSAYHIIEAKGATNYGVALAVARIIESVIRNEHSVFTVSTLLRGEYGIEDCCLSVPCIVNASGVINVIETDLSTSEANELTRSSLILKELCSRIVCKAV